MNYPLRPGVELAVKRLGMDELAVAHAIRDGELPSPQRYENFWLFNLRVTGTGAAYRDKNEEFTYRRPETYLNERFVERCAGLPVIMMHPEKKPMLDGVEYAKRNVGSIFVPYIRDDEVWCVAKIYDDAAATLMSERQLSTSPAVFFRHPEVNEKIDVNGDEVLVEGQPSLLDHLAICEQGVWDKGGEPLGVSLELQEKVMAETKKDNGTADSASDATAAMDAKLDAIISNMDAFHQRMDAVEERFAKEDKARKDAEELTEKERKEREERERADKAKRDSDEDEEEVRRRAAAELKAKEEKEKAKEDKAKKDAEAGVETEAEREAREKREREEREERERTDKAKKDAQTSREADLVKRLADLERRIPVQLSDAERSQFADAQSRADAIASMFGAQAGRPLDGEALLTYRKRQTRPFQRYSAAHKDLDLSVVPEVMWDNVEATIFQDARRAALNPDDVAEGQLREIVSTDRAGRRVSTFVGQPRAWMGEFISPSKYLTGISKERA